jgi:dipeptidyl-peptidase-4
MFGWSYGGYMSAMSVCRSPAGTYACAVAGAPVTSWDGYDTHYTGTCCLVLCLLRVC